MARSLEYKAFRRRYSYMRDTLAPSSVAGKAFERGLLTRAEKAAALHPIYTDLERNDRLLEAIEKRILADCEDFHTFVKVVELEHPKVAGKLNASYQEVCTDEGVVVQSSSSAPVPSRTPPPSSCAPSRTPPSSSRSPPPSSSVHSPNPPSSSSVPSPNPPQPNDILQEEESLIVPTQETQFPISETQPPVLETQIPVPEDRPPVPTTLSPVQETQQRENSCSGGVVVGSYEWFYDDCTMGRLRIDGGELDVVHYKAFEYSESKRKKSIELSFSKTKIEKSKKKHEHSPYPMKLFPHGVAVIINNEEFDAKNLIVREGTAVDEHNLIQTFRYLCYEVEVYRNCTSAQMLEIFKTVQQKDHGKYDSFVCCILSHGEEGAVFGCDGKPVVLSEVSAQLNARNCKSLAGKPKMFFIQACRGKIMDPAARIACDSPGVQSQSQQLLSGGGGGLHVPNEADFLFSYATPSGHVAIRHLDHGSWYVSELCKVLCSSSTHLHLDDMLKDVNKEVGKYSYHSKFDRPGEAEECRQVGEVTQRLNQNIYFF